jgi:HEAT repeat protein
VFTWLDSIRAWLLPFLYGLAAVFCLLLVGLVFWRAGEGVVAWRRRQLEARYRPVVGALFVPASQSAAMSRVTGTPRSHRALLGTLLLGALRPTTGAVMPRVVEAVWALGLPEQWIHDLADRRWWVRAAAVRALGFIHDTKNVDRVIGALDDPHEEVRTAAVDALGRIGDARAVPALIARLKDETRHQRARVVDALRLLGPPVVAPLIREAEAHPEHTPSIIDILGVIGATGAVERLLIWSGAPDPHVRAAATRAIGSIGLDDRSFYYALRGLADMDPTVRAMSARALGRSGRTMAAPYLGARLADDWAVAAHAASGLRRLGAAGRAQLEVNAGASGQAGVLARQMLWDISRRSKAS